jgi:hypothetical protein
LHHLKALNFPKSITDKLTLRLQIPLLTPHFTLSFLFFSDNIMADVVSKQQPIALFLSTKVTRTTKNTELTKKNDKPNGKPVQCQKTLGSVFRAVYFTHLNWTV